MPRIDTARFRSSLVLVFGVGVTLAAHAKEPTAEVIVDVFDLPAAPAPPAVVVAERARTTFATRCAQCHGPSGHGDGPVAKTLRPPPRNFSLSGWQRSVDDERIRGVIRMGGVSVGLSPLMPPHPDLEGDALAEMVALLRSFEQPPAASVFVTLEGPTSQPIANKRVRLAGASLRARFKEVPAGDVRVTGFVDLDGDGAKGNGEPAFELPVEPVKAGEVSQRKVRVAAPAPSAGPAK